MDISVRMAITSDAEQLSILNQGLMVEARDLCQT
jgi:hypothetical protein